MILLGSHVSFKAPNYLSESCEISINQNANTMMIYLGAPQNVRRVDVDKYGLDIYEDKYESLIPRERIVVHAPYIVNPSNPDKAQFAIDFLVQEIKRMDYAGFKYLVLHPGASVGYDVEEALDTLVDSLKEIIARTPDSNVVICIETMAGKGTEVGVNFEQLAHILQWVNNDRVQVCLDTCHVWDAGYDIKDYEEFKDELRKWDILKHIKVIHLNDSKNEVASHKDRHANIDKGTIGLKALQKFVFDPDFENIPIILETPVPETGPIYKEEIAMLLNKDN
ncbi:deoxyribonuclease IV [Mycoplasmopsis verecunda]|uniref:Probable endonuclease 4 n=1 Tax=Mycoplasmopsis verecunda TaxID=171291 RepID=A0A1T4M935_9BACT|nr:deoxyribonuclease IV [Mycoplasmopsis verecunda]WPB54499.1 deoxyribonuclease IV [Mycoplasmopsis verecunda]SJZ63560.1 Endonuclease IV [Mycoplasmopsis verecunda]